MAQQRQQRDPGGNVRGLHEWRLGEVRVVRDSHAAQIGDDAPTEARVNVLDVDFAADRVAGFRQNEAALLLDDPVEVEHRVGSHGDHDQHDYSDHNDDCPDELAHHDILSRPAEIVFSAEVGAMPTTSRLKTPPLGRLGDLTAPAIL